MLGSRVVADWQESTRMVFTSARPATEASDPKERRLAVILEGLRFLWRNHAVCPLSWRSDVPAP